MKLDPPIEAQWFYKGKEEKTKINWFCFEYALEFYTHVMNSKVLRRYRAKNSSDQIAAFCAYFAKRMKKSLYDRLARLTDAVIIDEEYIADYYPKNTQSQNKVFIEVAGQAWDELLSVCETCPVRCISERNQKSEFFDRYEKGGYLAE